MSAAKIAVRVALLPNNGVLGDLMGEGVNCLLSIGMPQRRWSHVLPHEDSYQELMRD